MMASSTKVILPSLRANWVHFSTLILMTLSFGFSIYLVWLAVHLNGFSQVNLYAMWGLLDSQLIPDDPNTFNKNVYQEPEKIFFPGRFCSGIYQNYFWCENVSCYIYLKFYLGLNFLWLHHLGSAARLAAAVKIDLGLTKH